MGWICVAQEALSNKTLRSVILRDRINENKKLKQKLLFLPQNMRSWQRWLKMLQKSLNTYRYVSYYLQNFNHYAQHVVKI
jgi:hypothetical protein